MTKDEFLQEIADALNEDAADLRPDTEVESLDGWDSTGLLGLIATLDGSLDIQVDVDQLRECRTIQDLVGLAAEKLD